MSKIITQFHRGHSPAPHSPAASEASSRQPTLVGQTYRERLQALTHERDLWRAAAWGCALLALLIAGVSLRVCP